MPRPYTCFIVEYMHVEKLLLYMRKDQLARGGNDTLVNMHVMRHNETSADKQKKTPARLHHHSRNLVSTCWIKIFLTLEKATRRRSHPEFITEIF